MKEIEFEDILNYSPVGIGWSDLKGNIEYVNHPFTTLFGYTLEDLPDLDTWYEKVYPDEEYREKVVRPQYKAVEDAHKKGLPLPKVEVNITCKDQTQRHVIIGFAYIGEKRLVNFSDMTAHWKSEQRNKTHDMMLEKVAKGMPLPDILHTIVLAIESEDPSSICSILLADENLKVLRYGASLSLPTSFTKLIEKIEIGEKIFACGMAAHLKECVVIEDITKEKFQGNYQKLLVEANVKSCWSEPIISSKGEVLGTFAIYHKTPSKPNNIDLERIKFATNLASIAIENRRVHEELEKRAYYDYLTGLANRGYFIEKFTAELSRIDRYGGTLSLIMFDIDLFKKVNDTYGHTVGDQVLKKIGETFSTVLRDIDIIGRIGGEEFAIVLPEIKLPEAIQVAQRLCKTIESITMDAEGENFHITISCGVTQSSDKQLDTDELLKEADQALYDAKEKGRNRVCSIKNCTA